MRILICLFGVIPRSIKKTYPKILEKIINPNSKNHSVKIYGFNLNVGDKLVDGVKLNQEDCRIVNYDYFDEHQQKDADVILDKMCKGGICVIQNVPYENQMTKNSLRVMYVEYQVSKFLKKHQKEFDYVIMWSADYLPLDELLVPDDLDSVYTSNKGDYLGGYTDGIYMGKIENIIKIQERYEDLVKILPYKGNHELIFKYGFVKNNIKRRVTDIKYMKLRANGDIRNFEKIVWVKKKKYPLPC